MYNPPIKQPPMCDSFTLCKKVEQLVDDVMSMYALCIRSRLRILASRSGQSFTGKIDFVTHSLGIGAVPGAQAMVW